MKPRTVVLLACSLIAICLGHGCGGREQTDAGETSHQYADVEEFADQYVRLMGEYVAAMDQADSAQEVATAINRLADGVERLQPAMQEVLEKYPELKNDQDMPEELRKIESRMQEIFMKMQHTLEKVWPYMDDPNVQKAHARLE